jgi:hypothetical protein
MEKKKVCFWLAGHENFFTLQIFMTFFMFMGRVGETINTLTWFILDVMIEAKKGAWIDLFLEHLHPQNSKQLLYFRIE